MRTESTRKKKKIKIQRGNVRKVIQIPTPSPNITDLYHQCMGCTHIMRSSDGKGTILPIKQQFSANAIQNVPSPKRPNRQKCNLSSQQDLRPGRFQGSGHGSVYISMQKIEKERSLRRYPKKDYLFSKK